LNVRRQLSVEQASVIVVLAVVEAAQPFRRWAAAQGSAEQKKDREESFHASDVTRSADG
jgi:hypothetical protein